MTTPDMTVLNIRKFPADLLKALKIRALEKDVTLRDLCIEILREGLKKKGGKSNG